MPDINASGLRIDVTAMIDNGVPVRIKLYTASGATTGYDDQVTVAQSGTSTWVSGLPFPLGGRKGSDEAVLIQQGRLLASDQKIYFLGTTVLSGEAVKVGIGSPTPVEHYIIPDGVQTYKVQNENVYKMAYIRILSNGSFQGE